MKLMEKASAKDDSSLNFPHHSQSQSNQIGLCFFRTLHTSNCDMVLKNIGRLIWGLADLKLWQKPEGEGKGAVIFVEPALGAGLTGIAVKMPSEPEI